MPSDDELRRVAEDVRALARSLGRDIRSALDRARPDGPGPEGSDGVPSGRTGRRSAHEDLTAAGRAARRELRRAQMAVRHSAPHSRRGDGAGRPDATGEVGPGWPGGPRAGGSRPAGPPRWDNWGRGRYRPPAGVRPGGRGWSGGPPWTPPAGVDTLDRPPVPTPVPAPPLRHRHDGSTLLGLLAVVFGLAWLVAGTHVAHVSTETVVALALMVVGGAMVVTARTDWALSRRSWPLAGGAALALVLLGLSASPSLPVGFRHLEFGSRIIAPTSWAEVPSDVHSGFGTTTVDLTGVVGTLPAARTLSVDSAAGRLEIVVPDTLKVVLDARISAGQIEVNGLKTSGVRRVDTETLNPGAPDPALTLRVLGGFGSVSVSGPSPVPTPFGGLPTPPSEPVKPGAVK